MYKKVVAGFAGIALTTLLATPAAADSWRDEQYWLEDYGFTEAWDTSMGEGVTVGVIDTGIDGSHQDLSGQIVGGYDASGTGDADGTTPMGPDPNHGTMVASLIAGHGHGDPPEQDEDEDDEDSDEDSDDEESEDEEEESEEEVEPEPIDEFGTDGILGTAPKAEILSVSVLLDDSAPEVPSVDAQIADGIHWLVNQGADVINISLASSAQDWPESWDDAFLHAEQNDVVVVVAAGNRASGSEIVGAPATIPGVLPWRDSTKTATPPGMLQPKASPLVWPHRQTRSSGRPRMTVTPTGRAPLEQRRWSLDSRHSSEQMTPPCRPLR